MKTLSVALSFIFFGGVALAAPKYPFVVEVVGKVKWTDRDGKLAVLKNKQVLIEKASFETEENGQVLIQVDAQRKLRLYGGGSIEIPAISWETGEAPVVLLKYGRMRWQEGPEKTYNVSLRSDVFEFLSPVGDFVFSFDPKAALAEVKVILGSMSFSAMNAEDVALVGTGQKCSFQGVLDGGQIVYDILLKGKKIPQGKLGLVQPLSSEEKEMYSLAPLKKKIKKTEAKTSIKKAVDEGNGNTLAICKSPNGNLNQCSWTCEGNPKKEKKSCLFEKPEVRCVRRRCNANGEWSEASEVSKEKGMGLCRSQPLVRECDY
ncbi:MAG: hypothetical protein IPM97_07590 [Bdellovibrionaceae bacterium]|nr:hypothetical protein [Pseudobdellovibrionaceae bacterium]